MTIRAVDYMQKLGGKPRVKFFYRCGYCRHATVLKRELWDYIRPPKCECGRSDWRLDMSRYNEWLNRSGPYTSCNCDGLPYPHRKASTVECTNHPEYAYGKPPETANMEYFND